MGEQHLDRLIGLLKMSSTTGVWSGMIKNGYIKLLPIFSFICYALFAKTVRVSILTQSTAQINNYLFHKGSHKTNSSSKLKINEAGTKEKLLKRKRKDEILLLKI